MYQCDHCKKWYHRKAPCVKHEEVCFHNPDNYRPCFDCVHLDKVGYTLYEDHPYLGETKRNIEIFQCQLKKHYLHTPLNEFKNNAYELGDDENKPMPIKCDLLDNGCFEGDIIDFLKLK